MNIQKPKVTLSEEEDPLGIIGKLPDGFRIGSNGSYIAPANTPEAAKFDADILNKMAATHSETQIPSDNPNFEGGALIDNERFAYEYFSKKWNT